MDYDEHCSLGRHNLFIISVIWHFLVVHVLEDPFMAFSHLTMYFCP